jgi:hypothetical protein
VEKHSVSTKARKERELRDRKIAYQLFEAAAVKCVRVCVWGGGGSNSLIVVPYHNLCIALRSHLPLYAHTHTHAHAHTHTHTHTQGVQDGGHQGREACGHAADLPGVEAAYTGVQVRAYVCVCDCWVHTSATFFYSHTHMYTYKDTCIHTHTPKDIQGPSSESVSLLQALRVRQKNMNTCIHIHTYTHK